MLQNGNGLVITTTVDKEFWRLLESEDDSTKEEDAESNGSNSEHQVAPTHVVCLRTAWLTSWSGFTGWQWVGLAEIWRARECRYVSVGESAGYHDANWLEARKKGEQEAAILGCISFELLTKDT